MAETTECEPLPQRPASSFRGLLDINNFKYTSQPEHKVPATAKRLIKRPLNKIDGLFKPTKPDINKKTSSSRKASVFLSSSVIESNNAPVRAPSVSATTDQVSKHQKATHYTLAPPSSRGKRKADALQDAMGSDAGKRAPLGMEGAFSSSKTTENSLRFERRLQIQCEDVDNRIWDPAHETYCTTNDPPSALTSKPTTTKRKKKKANSHEKSGYAPPSTFAHFGADPLRDALAPNLHILLCGLNPGLKTAETGHAYSSPTNRFWKIMHSSGVLPVPCAPQEDRSLPARFRLGLTNIVARPSRNGGQLSKAEMDDGVPALEAKVRIWRPEVVCLVGKGIWESVWRVHNGGRTVGKAFHSDFEYGWQDECENMGVGEVGEHEREEGVVYDADWKGARVFVASSTSGLAATLKPADKGRIWRELGIWVEKRRAEDEDVDHVSVQEEENINEEAS